MKKTMIAVALALASMTANAANNPEDWRVSYASVMEHYNAGRLSQAYAELPRLGLSGSQLDSVWSAIQDGKTWSSWDDFNGWVNSNGNNGNGNNGNGNGGSNGQPTSYDKQQDAVIDTKADKAAFEADQKRQDDALASEVAQREDGDNRLNASIDQTKQAIANESNIRNQKDQELQAQIDTKVSKDDFDASQQAQNDHINAVQDAAQTANDLATALEGRADGTEAAIRETNNQLEVTDARSIDNAKRLDGVEQVNDRQDSQIADNKAAIEQEAKDRAAGDAATLQSANTYTDGAVKSQADKQQLVDAAQDGQIAGNTAAIAQEAKDRAAGDAATLTAANTHADKAVATEAAARADGDAKTLKDANSFTTGAVKAQADIQKGVDAAQDGQIAGNTAAIAQEAKDRAAGDAATLTAANTHADKAVATEAAARADGDAKTLKDANSFTTGAVKAQADIQKGVDAKQDGAIAANATAIKTETAVRSQQFNQLSAGVQQAQATGEYAHARIDAANANIEANRQALANTNKRVAANTAQLANHEQRLTSLEQQTNKGFSDLKRQIDDNKKDANAGIAGVAAIASIPQVTDKQDFSVGAGVGARGSEQALAVGFSGRITDNVVTKVAVSTDTQSGWTVGAGVSYGW